jgi:ribosomal protein S18 acetylase RimI-like enzyme
MDFLELGVHNVSELEEFLERLQEGKTNFRYFNKRPLTVISDHLITLLIRHEGLAVGYGHLDREDGITWLGIAVADKERGKGIGRLMMKELIKNAALKGISEIFLTVDKTNVHAIELYKTLNFNLVSESETYFKYKLIIK